MILGFAHLAINVSNITKEERAWEALGYVRQAFHQSVPNHPSKQIFSKKHRPLHDLMLLAAPGLWPLELTCHGPTNGQNDQLHWSAEAITVALKNPIIFRILLSQGLGFQEEDSGALFLNSKIPGWDCRVHLETATTEAVRLDAEGPTCLAFYSTHPVADAERLIKLGGVDCTGCFELNLSERHLSIVLLRTPGGPVLELIKPRSH